MKKLFDLLNKLFDDPKSHVLFIIFFGFFAIMELMAKQYFYAIADLLIVIGELFNLADCCRRKKQENK